ncbi:MAG TPA: translesion DNA synthesis-associated protein ImuA [Burkholderiales bacterium]|nr:translesion DNA synthesis-associated protein ImuA [Burkholderiales bacterium]
MAQSDPALTALLQRAEIRRASELAKARTPGISTGFASLDAELPGGGWPSGVLTEILPAHEGIGELRLLSPALATLSQRGLKLAWIAPPYLPYAPALVAAGIDLSTLMLVKTSAPTDSLWAAEQCLKSAACAALLFWPHHKTTYTDLRRLQLAAAETSTFIFLFRPPQTAQSSSPAALRLKLAAASGGLSIHILKRRGLQLSHPLFLSPAPPHAMARPLLSSAPIRPESIAV